MKLLPLLVLLGLPAIAQTDYEKILLPISTPAYVPGAFDTVWLSRLRILNSSDIPIAIGKDLFPLGECAIGECTPTVIEPRHEIVPPVFNPVLGPRVGSLLYVRRDRAKDVHFALHLEEHSGRGSAAGTEIPVIREGEMRTDTINLLGVRLRAPDFRAMLRIYDVDARPDAAVEVTVWSPDGQLLARREITLEAPYPGPITPLPGYAQLSLDAGNLPEFPGPRFGRVTIRPLTSGLRYWAFISLTENESQTVTTITPQ